MATTTDTSRIIVDTTQATTALAKLQASLDGTTKMFGGIKSTIAGLGFAALARSAVLAADEMSDLSKATGISVARIKELEEALGQAGGSGGDVTKFVTTFTKSLEEARDGSLAAQNSFVKLGLSIDDIGKLSTVDAINKTLVGIENLGTESAKTTAMMDKFGKSARTISAADLSAELAKTAGSGDQYSNSIERAADLNDKFVKAMGNLRTAFLVAFEPTIIKINEFADSLDKSKEKINTLAAAIKTIGVVMATSFAAGILTSFVTMIGSMGRGIGVLIGLFGSGATGKFVTTLFQATGHAAKLIPILRAIALLFSAGLGIYTASQLFDNFGDVATNALSRVIEGLGDTAAAILNLPTDAIAGIANLFGAKIKDPWGLGTPIKNLVDKAKQSREEFEKTAKAAKDAVTAPKATAVTDTPANAPVDRTEYNNMVKAVQDLTNAYSRANDKIRNQIDLDNSLIGQSKELQDLRRAENELTQRTADEVEKLTEAKSKLSKKELEAGMADVYDAEIAKVKALGAEEKTRLETAVKETNKLQAIEQLRLFNISSQITLNQQLRGLQEETAKVFLPEIERRYKDIEAAATESAKAAIAAEEARRGNVPLSAEEAAKYYETARQGVDALKNSTTKLTEEQNKFQLHLYSIQEQISASNSLNSIQDEMAKMTMPEIEKKYYDIAAAARDSAKAAIEAEETRRNAKLDPAEAQAYYDAAYAGVQKVTDATRKNWELSRTFSTGWTQAWQDYADNATNAAVQAKTLFDTMTKTADDAFDKLIGDSDATWKTIFDNAVKAMLKSEFKNTLGQLMNSVGGANQTGSNTGGGVFSSIGKFFAGGFANGGYIPAGGYGITGENGPEYVNGPATITPMQSGGDTYHVSITAMDSQDVARAISQHPELIYGLSQKGARAVGA